MPDQLTDRARKAAEEIFLKLVPVIKYSNPCNGKCENCDFIGECRSAEEMVTAEIAAIITRHWREHIESEKKIIRSGEIPAGCRASSDDSCFGECFRCDRYDDQHVVIKKPEVARNEELEQALTAAYAKLDEAKGILGRVL